MEDSNFGLVVGLEISCGFCLACVCLLPAAPIDQMALRPEGRLMSLGVELDEREDSLPVVLYCRCFGALLFLRRLMLSGIVCQIVHHAVKFLKCPGLYPWASEPLLGALPVWSFGSLLMLTVYWGCL
ncbi:hypothetical protein Nepgr_002665 [Nepenthes gracilis]|uniref:Uncharacterized protein n=1 Tax=Nepenthes gracilis TaxID=150966 RepID=A0AAD3P794_NEPGR|nr:hypothetical protein Nepgr_002665 [Nepenthes gracilis]